MPVDVILLDVNGEEVRAMPDPAGGTFDAAGAFDRLLDADDRLRVWPTLDPDGLVILGAAQCQHLLEELPVLMELSRSGPERRGLERLQVMAEECVGRSGAVLHVRGD